MLKLKYPLILASNSPRRKELLANTGIAFKVSVQAVEESIPDFIQPLDTAGFLAQVKSEAYLDLAENAIVVTADTVVIQNNRVFGKPESFEEAVTMLTQLSGKWHEVITGVCIRHKEDRDTFSVSTKVLFDTLTEAEIHYYIEKYKPYDKAGAYGIQEWIGHIGIKYIEGSYYNVMGLPIQALYQHLKKYHAS